YSLVQSADRFAVLDIGGDDAGAYALGRYVPYIKREDNYDMLYVVNFLRPLTQSAESAFEVMKEIEGACGLSFTGIVNNTNLGDETTKQIIVNSAEKAEKLSALSGIPVKFTSAEEKHCSEGLFPLKLQPKYYQ
nr:ParA family protein [Clostridiales bacterium]